MRKDHKWRESFQYKLDNMFSKGTPIVMIWLGVISLLIILLASLLIILMKLSPHGLSAFDILWQTSMRTISPGEIDDHTSWGYRVVMFFVTMGGLFITSTLIGLISTGINQYIETLQRGRSKVVEEDHIVILGWNNQVFTIIEELVVSNNNQTDRCIVVMGQRDKKEMEHLIHENVPNLNGMRIVVRTGNPMVPNSLEILNLDEAKAIIVLSPDRDDPDSEVIKICLAITKQPNFLTGNYHIVAELRDPRNIDVVNVLGKEKIQWILTGEVIARITAQTLRQSGLSLVYTDLLDYAGDEIYFFAAEEIVDLTFGECLNLFEKNAVMGMISDDGTPYMNPPMTQKIQKGDKLFLLAEDNHQIHLNRGGTISLQENLIRNRSPLEKGPESFLIIGWNWRAPLILRELDFYVPLGSTVTIFCDAVLIGGPIDPSAFQFNNLSLDIQYGDTTDRRLLDDVVCHRYSHVLLLCYCGHLSPQVADAKSLITLLHLRDILDNDSKCQFSITSEMMDTTDRDLAEVAQPDDFIISSKLISLMFSQIAERKERKDIFVDIFNQQGNEIYLKPVGDYVLTNIPVNFYTVVESARRKGEVALGYRQDAYHDQAKKNYGIVLNPRKSLEVSFSEYDSLIVISKDE